MRSGIQHQWQQGGFKPVLLLLFCCGTWRWRHIPSWIQQGPVASSCAPILVVPGWGEPPNGVVSARAPGLVRGRCLGVLPARNGGVCRMGVPLLHCGDVDDRQLTCETACAWPGGANSSDLGQGRREGTQRRVRCILPVPLTTLGSVRSRPALPTVGGSRPRGQRRSWTLLSAAPACTGGAALKAA